MVRAQADAILRYAYRVAGSPRAEAETDRRLLERFAAVRDEAAFAQLVRRHGPMVLRVCRHVLRQTQDAEDAFQAAFLVLARRAGSVRWRDCVAGWLYEVAVRVARKARRAEVERRDRQREAAEVRAMQPRAEQTDDELRAALYEAIGDLPEKYRLPVVLCDLEGHAHAGAARLLGWPVGTIKGRLARARQRLRKQLAGRGFTGAAAAVAALLPGGTSAATVPAVLVQGTARAAVLFAAGASSAGVASTQAVALATGALHTMGGSKVVLGLALTLSLALGLMAGSPRTGQPAPANDPPAPPAAAQPLPAGPARTDVDGQPLPEHALARLGSAGHFRPGMRVDGAAISPDGKTLALASLRAVTLWDLATGKQIRAFEAPGFTVLMANSAVAFSPDGQLLVAAASTAQTVHVWEAATGKHLHALRHGQWVHHLTFAPDGKTLATTASGGAPKVVHLVHLWDVQTGQPLRELEGHQNTIASVAFSPDGRALASGGLDSTVRLWEVATGQETHKLQAPALAGYRGWVGGVSFSPDGKLVVSAHGDGLIRVWDSATGKKLRELKGHRDGVASVVFSPDGKVLASGSSDHTIRLWDLAAGKGVRQIVAEGQNWGMTSLAFSPDGATLVSWGGIHTVRFWDVVRGKETRRTAGHLSDVSKVSFAPDGKALLSWGQDRTLRRWDLPAGRERCLPVGTNWATEDHAVAFSPDGRLLALGTGADTIDLWDTATGALVRNLKGHKQWVSAVAFSPDGKVLASASSWDRTIRVWDVATAQTLQTWEAFAKGEDEEIRALVFSPDGKVLASGGNTPAIRLWDVAGGKELRRFQGHAEGPFPTQQPRPVCIAFAPDGRTVASVRRNDPAIYLWEADTAKLVRRLEWPVEPGFVGAFALAFSPTGRALAVTELDGTVGVWETATGKRIRRFSGHRGDVHSLAFSADGRQLATGGSDSTILVWDLTGRAAKGRDGRPGLSSEEAERLWIALGGEDAAKAHDALWRLADAPGPAVSFLQKQLRPATAPDAERLQRLLRDLDSPRFAVRDRATKELEMLGTDVEPVLKKALEGRPSAEMRRRVEQLLEKLRSLPARQLRELRALEVLELAATAAARTLLETLANGTADAWLTREARRALQRLGNNANPGG